MSNSFPIQKKWLDDVKDTMKAEEFAELNYRINIYLHLLVSKMQKSCLNVTTLIFVSKCYSKY